VSVHPPGKKVAILGLGVSGFQSASFLANKGFDVFASDAGDSAEIRERASRLEKQGAEFEYGRHTPERILTADWILISPGIAPRTPIYETVRSSGLPLVSEIEAASWFSAPSQRIIAVTGSAGKTTVTTLLRQVFCEEGKAAVLCGNIGNPWIGELERMSGHETVILEISSFQLMHCESFRPHIGILLNVSGNHLDWHADMGEYVRAKLRLFRNQKREDHALIRLRDRENYFPGCPFPGSIDYFGEDPDRNPNEEAVTRIVRLCGLDARKAERVIRSFPGIEHRLEKVACVNGVTYVNDSKATTPASLCWALDKYPEGEVILIAGGHPKSPDFGEARECLRRKAAHAVLLGEAVPLLREAWAGSVSMTETGSLEEAVTVASRLAKKGQTVLLSPACASFDMFRNYQERGCLFKRLVARLADSVSPEKVRMF